MTTLTALATELAGLTPPTNGVPTTGQYEAAVRDAVVDFGFRCPQLLRASLAVVAGTAAYALPVGFLRLVKLEGVAGETLYNPDGFLVSMAYVPTETHTISAGQITFYPTPGYTLARSLSYAAGYPYDMGTDAFIGLTAEYERIVMMKAQAGALRLLAGATGGSGGLTYSIGDTSVQRALTSPYTGLADALNKQYLDACRAVVGFIGRRTNTAVAGWSY